VGALVNFPHLRGQCALTWVIVKSRLSLVSTAFRSGLLRIVEVGGSTPALTTKV
jgi:hypothetical protein